MAAPDATKWGSVVGDYGKIGIYRSETKTNDKISGTIEIWFWSKYSVSDTNNTLYYNNLASSGSATTSLGSKSISTTSNSGGWSTTNQKKLYSVSYSHSRGTSDATRYLYAKLANVDRVGGTMYVSTTYTIPKLPTYTVKYNANGGSGAPANQTKTYNKALTLSTTKPTRTGYTFLGWSTSATATSVSYASGGSYTANSGITLYAVWKINTYVISYNANGGSGAPGNQTKTYGKTLTLSTTKPTRTGYTFLGWSTSSSATSATYSAGGSFTSNAETTLYAVWKINTYTVKYNANGGSGAPANQTKTHGEPLTLSSSKPTKTNYNFLGWSTSSSATSATYSAGASFATNANTTLYAVWQLAYTPPTITGLTIKRCDYDETTGEYTPSDTGTSVHVSFNWTTFHDVSSVKIEWHATGQSSGTSSLFEATGKSGSINTYVHAGVSTESTYTFKVTVSDSGGSTDVSKQLLGAKYVIDLKAGGKGISFGKTSELDDTADFAFSIYPRAGFICPVLPDGTDLNDILTPNVYVGENLDSEGIAYKNAPTGSGTFTLEVLSSGPNGQITQRFTRCHKLYGNTYERTYYTNAWGPWYGGWQTINPSDEFSVYGNGTENDLNWNGIRYRRVGDTVEVRGVVTPKADIAYGTDFHLICTLPEGYRPDRPLYNICQGSGTCVWLLQVSHNGEVQLGRYRNGDTGATAANGTWLPFHCTFTV